MPKRTKRQRFPTFEGRQLQAVPDDHQAAQIAQARREGRLKTFDDFTAEQVAEIAVKVARWKATGIGRVTST